MKSSEFVRIVEQVEYGKWGGMLTVCALFAVTYISVMSVNV